MIQDRDLIQEAFPGLKVGGLFFIGPRLKTSLVIPESRMNFSVFSMN